MIREVNRLRGPEMGLRLRLTAPGEVEQAIPTFNSSKR
jgi:hypothetical protein